MLKYLEQLCYLLLKEFQLDLVQQTSIEGGHEQEMDEMALLLSLIFPSKQAWALTSSETW